MDDAFAALGRFVTTDGRAIALDANHRASVRVASGSGYAHAWKPSSRGASPPGDDDADVAAYLRAVSTRVDLASRLLAMFGPDLRAEHAGRTLDVLVVGASDGAESALLAGMGHRVTGIDYGSAFLGELAQRRARVFASARRHAATLGLTRQEHAASPRLIEDDLTRSQLPAASFDLIVSWQTLEHVMDLPAAMHSMRRLLRPGGLTFHEYNPFFALDGGHSLCTLDAPWLHARLAPDDVQRFLRKHRPATADEAWAFYAHALNRQPQSAVMEAAARAGLATEAFVPRTRTEDLMLLTPEVLAEARSLDGRVTVVDLISRIVRVVLRSPA